MHDAHRIRRRSERRLRRCGNERRSSNGRHGVHVPLVRGRPRSFLVFNGPRRECRSHATDDIVQHRGNDGRGRHLHGHRIAHCFTTGGVRRDDAVVVESPQCVRGRRVLGGVCSRNGRSVRQTSSRCHEPLVSHGADPTRGLHGKGGRWGVQAPNARFGLNRDHRIGQHRHLRRGRGRCIAAFP